MQSIGLMVNFSHGSNELQLHSYPFLEKVENVELKNW